MEAIVGNREDSILFSQEGFLYLKNKRRANKQYVKCRTKGCFCYGLVSESASGASVISVLSENHNHPPDQDELDVLKLKQELRMVSLTDKRPPKQVFDDVCRRYPTVKHLISTTQARSIMETARNKNKPPTPHSITEMCRMLQGEWSHLGLTLGEIPENFYVTCIESTDSTCAIFASPTLIKMMDRCENIHIDATFKVLPTELNGYQLCTIHAVYMDKVFPVVYIIMDRKTTGAYVDVFMYIRDILCPNFSPRFVMADYETAIKNAVNNVWPNATVNGCWFHYAQGVWKMHKSMHMSELTKYNPAALKSLRMLMCLPLLPGNKISEGLRQTRLYITENGLDLEFNDLVGYINEFWIEGVGCETISVCGLLNRTNNAVESFYSEIGRTIGKHPGVWDFIDKLRLVEDCKATDYLRLQNGINPTRRRRRAFRRQDSAIYDATERLRLSNFTRVREFLERISHRVTSLERNLRYPRRRVAATQPPIAEPEADEEDQALIGEGQAVPADAEQVDAVLSEEDELVPAMLGGGQLIGVPPDEEAIAGLPDERGEILVLDHAEGMVPLAQPSIITSTTVQNNELFGRPALVGQRSASIYEMYRVVPIHIDENNLMSQEDVAKQQRELMYSLTLGEEPSYEAAEEGEVVCTVCITNAPTRICSPCGHAIVCRSCLPNFVRTKLYYHVIELSGNTYETTTRLPLTCPTCRSLIGQLIQMF